MYGDWVVEESWPVITVPSTKSLWLWIGLAAALAGAGGYAIYRARRKR